MSKRNGSHEDRPFSPTSMDDATTAVDDERRRSLVTLLGALGAVALGGCASETHEAAESDGLDDVLQALSGGGVLKVADSAANLRIIFTGASNTWVAVLQGISAAGDGGGGVFYWSTVAKADDGWSSLNNGSANSAGWRRANLGFVRAGTVATLRGLTGAATATGTGRSLAILDAYATPGDGGGGIFVWSTTADDDDDGTVFNAGGFQSNSAGWRRVHSDALNVRWFGAKGDASTPDHVAIQRALDVAPAQATRGVYFPPGIYKIGATLIVRPNTHLRGHGCATTAIYQTGINFSGSAWTMGPYNLIDLTPGTSFNSVLVQNVVIEDICFMGENGPTPVNPNNVFRQTPIELQAGTNAIRVPESTGPSSDVTVRCCRFLSLYGNVFRTDGGGKRMVFNDNQCLYCGGEVNIGDGDSQVNDNLLDTVWGIECANQRIQVCRNIVRNAGNSGISIGGDGGYQNYTSDATGAATVGDFGCIVTDNIIDAPAALGIAVGVPLVGAIISRNQITRVSGGYHGISFNPAFGAPIASFCKIEDNLIQSGCNYGIWCGQGGYQNVFRRNKITVNTMVGSAAGPLIGLYLGPGLSDGCIVEDNEVRGTLHDMLFVGAANCVVRGNKGRVRLEGAASTFIAEESGTITFSGSESTKTVTLLLPRVSSESYRVQLTPAQTTGAPAVGSNRILSVVKTATGYTVTLETAPVGGTVAFDWSAVGDGIG